MTYRLKALSKENQINRVLKKQKRDKNKIAILFYSEWDDASQSVISDLRAQKRVGSPTENIGEEIDLFLVNSFQMPHSFVIFKTQKVPHLVILNKDKVTSVDYLPLLCEELGI